MLGAGARCLPVLWEARRHHGGDAVGGGLKVAALRTMYQCFQNQIGTNQFDRSVEENEDRTN